MVELTEYEQKMLDGAEGTFKQRAIKKIVDYANALGAEELVPVTKKRLMQPPVAQLPSGLGGLQPEKTIRWTRKQEAAGPFEMREEIK